MTIDNKHNSFIKGKRKSIALYEEKPKKKIVLEDDDVNEDYNENIFNDYHDDDNNSNSTNTIGRKRKASDVCLNDVFSVEIYNELLSGFQSIANHIKDITNIYKIRLDEMQKCIERAGLNYQTAIDSLSLYEIWVNTQNFNSFDKYMLDIVQNKHTCKSSKCLEDYM